MRGKVQSGDDGGDHEDLEDEPDEGQERTAILNLRDLNVPAESLRKNRHLLVMVQGSQLGQVFVLTDEACRIGRQEDSQIVLSDAGISRKHARIVAEDDGYLLQDLGSANGTFVHGERVSERMLVDGDLIQFGPGVVVRYSITDRDHEAMLRHLYEASITDPLTRAYNREHFDVRLRAELSYARRHKTDLSLVMLDVDHFKNVNDTYGHQAGDAVLIELSAKLPKALRNEDVFARYGGEEFAVILREIDITGARAVGERLRTVVKSMQIRTGDQLIRITASVGCGSLSQIEAQDSAALIALADRRLYVAKRAGRDRVVHAD
jgi:two-component system, cell cycle response regulator